MWDTDPDGLFPMNGATSSPHREQARRNLSSRARRSAQAVASRDAARTAAETVNAALRSRTARMATGRSPSGSHAGWGTAADRRPASGTDPLRRPRTQREHVRRTRRRGDGRPTATTPFSRRSARLKGGGTAARAQRRYGLTGPDRPRGARRAPTKMACTPRSGYQASGKGIRCTRTGDPRAAELLRRARTCPARDGRRRRSHLEKQVGGTPTMRARARRVRARAPAATRDAALGSSL